MATFSYQVLIQAQEIRKLESYNQIYVAGDIEIKLVKSDVLKAEIKMVEGDEKDLVTEVKNSKLNIYFDDGKTNNWRSSNKAIITLGFDEVSCLKASANAQVKSETMIQFEVIEIEASSGANLNLNIENKEIDLLISSSANLTLIGASQKMNATISSGSKLEASGFLTSIVNVTSSSGAEGSFHATKSITARASSGSKISYTGNPDEEIIDQGNWSSASINKY